MPPVPSAPQEPAAAPEVTYGKLLNVPDNFLDAGVVGRGWTIVGTNIKDGRPQVKLVRRVKQTGQVEELAIDAEKYEQAKAYKDQQGGVGKAWVAPILKASDMGRPVLDPQGELVPEFFDAASRSYRLRIPGGQPGPWVQESLIRDLKQGKPGAVERLKKAAGFSKDDATTPQNTSPGQAITGAVAKVVFGKSLASRLGLERASKEATPDRQSEEQADADRRRANIQEKKDMTEITAEERAAREEAERGARKRRRLSDDSDEEDEEEEENEETSGQAPLYRAIPIAAAGQAATAASQTEPPLSPTVRIPTTRTTSAAQTSGRGIPLPLTPSLLTDAPTVTVQQPAQTANGAELTEQAVRYTRPRKTKSTTDTAPSDPVEALLARSQDRSSKKQRFAELSQNKQEFKKLLFVDPAQVLKTNHTQIIEETLAEWDKKQQNQAIEYIDRQYQALESNPAFRELAYTIGLEQLKNDPSDYFRRQIAGKNIYLDTSGWVLEKQTNKRIGHVFSIDLDNKNGLATHHQIKYAAIKAWRQEHPVSSTGVSRIGNRESRGKTTTPVAFEIRQMRKLLRDQARDQQVSRIGNRESRVGKGSTASLRIPDTHSPLAATISGQALTAQARQQPIMAATGLADLSREEAIQRIQANLITLTNLSKQIFAQRKTTQSARSLREAQKPEEESGIESKTPPPTSPEIQYHLTILHALKEAVEDLPEGTTVPADMNIDLPEIPPELLLEEQAPTAPETPIPPTPFIKGEPDSPFSIPNSRFPIPDSLPPSPPHPSRRIGAPPVPSRVTVPPISARAAPSALAGRIKPSLLLPAALAAMTGMNAQQARERMPRDDAYTSVLGQDTSTPEGAASGSSPLDIAQTHNQLAPSREPTEDILTTPSEEAEAMRLEGDKAKAAQAQFSPPASQPAGGLRPPASPAIEPPPATDQEPLSPADQRIAAIKMQALQASTAKDEEEATTTTETQTSIVTTRTPAGLPSARLTKAKLGWDLIEGVADQSLGYFQFLTEANLALVNDEYWHLSLLPSLKTPGASERFNRYFRYGILLLDGLIITAVTLVMSVVIVLFYMLVS